MKDQIGLPFPMKILKVSPYTAFKIAKSFEKYTYWHTAPFRYGADSVHGSKMKCYGTPGCFAKLD